MDAKIRRTAGELRMLGELLTWVGVGVVALVAWTLYLSATREAAEEAPEAVPSEDSPEPNAPN
jgi:hypothetical protein